MNSLQTRQYLGEFIFNLVAPSDFKQDYTDLMFARALPTGRQMIGVPFFDYGDNCEASLVMCVRNDDIESIYHLVSNALPQHQNESWSLIVQLSYFTGQPERLSIKHSRDIRVIADMFESIIKSRVIPFLDSVNHVHALDDALNNPRNRSIDTSFHPSRGIHGVIAAHLAGRIDYDAMVIHYRQEMEQLGLCVEDIHKYEQIVNVLHKKQSNL